MSAYMSPVDAVQMCLYESSIHLRMRAQIFAQSSAPSKLLDDERPNGWNAYVCSNSVSISTGNGHFRKM